MKSALKRRRIFLRPLSCQVLSICHCWSRFKSFQLWFFTSGDNNATNHRRTERGATVLRPPLWNFFKDFTKIVYFSHSPPSQPRPHLFLVSLHALQQTFGILGALNTGLGERSNDDDVEGDDRAAPGGDRNSIMEEVEGAEGPSTAGDGDSPGFDVTSLPRPTSTGPMPRPNLCASRPPDNR